MRFHECNNISQNFSGITLGFCEVSKYFVDFRFHFRYFWKMTPKFWFCSYRFEILKFRTFLWQNFKKSILQLPRKCYWEIETMPSWIWSAFFFEWAKNVLIKKGKNVSTTSSEEQCNTQSIYFQSIKTDIFMTIYQNANYPNDNHQNDIHHNGDYQNNNQQKDNQQTSNPQNDNPQNDNYRKISYFRRK